MAIWSTPIHPRARALLSEIGASDEDFDAVEFAFTLFKLRRDEREQAKPPKAVLDHMERTERAVVELRECLLAMPDQISISLTELLMRAGKPGYSAAKGELLKHLEFIRGLHWDAERRFEDIDHPGAGERPKHAEAELLCDLDGVVSSILGGPKLRSAELAGQLAVLLGVSGLPTSGKALADRIRRHRASAKITR